jgi:hypothetical protein
VEGQVPHPDFEKIEALGPEAQLLRTYLVLTTHFGPRVLDDFREGFPVVAGPPGLRALVAPDGVTVRVLRGDESPGEVRRFVLADVAERYVRSEVAGMVALGASPEDVDVAAHRILLRVKSRYSVEPVSGSRSDG